MSLPFIEKSLGNNQYIREFNADVDTHELEWHIDKEDRTVEVIENIDWQFQLDNNLPQLLKETIFIPKETYHRVIKGTGNLKVKITKLTTTGVRARRSFGLNDIKRGTRMNIAIIKFPPCSPTNPIKARIWSMSPVKY